MAWRSVLDGPVECGFIDGAQRLVGTRPFRQTSQRSCACGTPRTRRFRGRHERGTFVRRDADVSTSTFLPSVRTAFTRLVDYAGLFPPAKLDMRSSVEEYVAARAGSHAWMLGRFIVPASRLKELKSVMAGLPAGSPEIPLSVIVDAHNDPHTWFNTAHAAFTDVATYRANGMRIEALEVPLPPLPTRRETHDANIGQCAMLAERAGLRSLPVYVELPRDERFIELVLAAFTALSRYRLSAKIRCGGVVAEAFPSVDELAAFVSTAVEENVPFKATAGLHHPIRHHNEPTGFMMHGFLNVLAATVFARNASAEELREILSEEAPSAFLFEERSLKWSDRSASLEQIAAAREHAFIAYGSCSFAEPVDDLTALTILTK